MAPFGPVNNKSENGLPVFGSVDRRPGEQVNRRQRRPCRQSAPYPSVAGRHSCASANQASDSGVKSLGSILFIGSSAGANDEIFAHRDSPGTNTLIQRLNGWVDRGPAGVGQRSDHHHRLRPADWPWPAVWQILNKCRLRWSSIMACHCGFHLHLLLLDQHLLLLPPQPLVLQPRHIAQRRSKARRAATREQALRNRQLGIVVPSSPMVPLRACCRASYR